ncbi:carbon starvation induced protein CsiD [Xenorhabdus stockiae]|uniref:carbon starvation induced protein CsiD n=1 Tax=Xenorhabdus stockiae TaxID=351614 RepID=UPI003CF0597B
MLNVKDNGENTIILLPQERNAIYSSLQKIPDEYDQENTPLELEKLACNIISNNLNNDNLIKLLQFEKDNNIPFLHIKNFLPLTDYPPTPNNDLSPTKQGWKIPAAALLGLLHLTGHTARSFLDEMGGRLCHMVMPSINDEKSYLRSTKKLNFHTEVVNGYFQEENPVVGSPLSPESFGLIGLRNPDNIPTTLLPLREVMKNLKQKEIDELMKKNFTARSQSSFDKNIEVKNISILSPCQNGEIGIRYSNSKIKGNNKYAQQAYEAMTDVIKNSESIQYVSLAPGDVLIVNNRICLHGRSSITDTAKFNGEDRWLIRIYGYKKHSTDFMKIRQGSNHIMEVDI